MIANFVFQFLFCKKGFSPLPCADHSIRSPLPCAGGILSFCLFVVDVLLYFFFWTLASMRTPEVRNHNFFWILFIYGGYFVCVCIDSKCKNVSSVALEMFCSCVFVKLWNVYNTCAGTWGKYTMSRVAIFLMNNAVT